MNIKNTIRTSATHARILLKAAILTTALAAATSASAGETFGLGSQSTFVSAMQFRVLAGGASCDLQAASGNGLYFGPATGCPVSTVAYVAPLDLPEGAYIDSGYSLYHGNAAGTSLVTAVAHSDVLMGDTTAAPPAAVAVASSTSSTIAGYGMQTLSAASYPAEHVFDSYRGGMHRTYFMLVQMPSTGVSLNGIGVYYHRQIAPAPATASFTDIPTTHPFFNEIEQLKKSGITLGCTATTFCPDAPVTRGQMAAFLSRALGLQWDANTDAS